jgi:hypothetical protein
MHIFLNAIYFANINITKENLIYILIPVILVLAAIVFSVAIYRNSKKDKQYDQAPQEDDNLTFEDAIRIAGYDYDNIQDIFYSRIEEGKKKSRYCQFNDRHARH